MLENLKNQIENKPKIKRKKEKRRKKNLHGWICFLTQACCALSLVTRKWAQLHAERNWCHSGLPSVPLLFCRNGIGAATSRKAVHLGSRSLCPFVGQSAIGERPMPERAIISYRWGPRFVSLFFSPARPRPSAVAKSSLLSYLACSLTFLPPAFSLSLARTKVAELLLSRSSEKRAFHSDSGKCRLLQLSLQRIWPHLSQCSLSQNCSAAICVSLLSLVSDSHSFGLFLPFLGCFCMLCWFSLCSWRMLAFA